MFFSIFQEKKYIFTYYNIYNEYNTQKKKYDYETKKLTYSNCTRT